MSKSKNGQKNRGLLSGLIEVMKKDDRLMELLRDPDIFLGIRNNYCNIYYHCASMGKLSLKKNALSIETHNKYLKPADGDDDSLKGYYTFEGSGLDEFYKKAAPDGMLRKCIEKKAEKKKEKVAQQKLVLANNANDGAQWFCVDLEYVQERDSSEESCFGRFDIVAVSRKPDHDGIHTVAIIELKVGASAYSSALPKKAKLELEQDENIRKEKFDIAKYNWSLGSGLLGHMADFYRFETRKTKRDKKDESRFSLLRDEICSILKSRANLGLPIPDSLRDLISEHGQRAASFSDTPQFYFLTLCSKSNRATCKKSFKNYMNSKTFNAGASEYNVSDVFALRVNKSFDNYHFLFSKVNWNTGLESKTSIDDILDEENYFENLPLEEVFPGLTKETAP